MNEIQFILNGKPVSYAGSAADRLLDVLRDTFRCTSVKCGCKEGECGACSALLDGKLEERKGISEDAEFVRIGAAVTYTEALASPIVPQLMKEAISRIAAPLPSPACRSQAFCASKTVSSRAFLPALAQSRILLRYRDLEAMLVGKTVEEAKAEKAALLNAYSERMVLTRGRVSTEYRKTVCMNLLADFLTEKGI